MKPIVLIAALLILPIAELKAATLKANSRACISEDYFDQQVKAKTSQDMLALEYLFKNGYCIMMNKDYKGSILDSTFSGKVKVRVYAGKNTVELWTYKESIQQ